MQKKTNYHIYFIVKYASDQGALARAKRYGKHTSECES